MVRSDPALKNCIESVNKTISDCKTLIRNRAMLQNVTSLAPVTECKTRWSGKYLLLKRFNRIYDQLQNVAEDERSAVAMNLTPQFKAGTMRYSKMLSQLDEVTKYLQLYNISLSDCRLAFDSIAESVDDGKHDPDSDLYQCQLGARAISPVSRLVTDKYFEQGAFKIQRNQLRSMSSSEKNACRSLLLSNHSTAIVSGSDSGEDGEKSIMASITKKRRDLSSSTAKYINS